MFIFMFTVFSSHAVQMIDELKKNLLNLLVSEVQTRERMYHIVNEWLWAHMQKLKSTQDALYHSSACFLLAQHHTTQSPLNLPKASLSAHLLLRENGPHHHSSLFLLHVAVRPGASPASHDSTVPTALHGRTSCSGQTCSVKMTRPYVHILHFFHSREILSLHLWPRLSVTEPVVCRSVMTWWHFINIMEEAVRVAPESPFVDMCDLMDPSLYMHIDPTMHCTQGGHFSGCHVTSGFSQADKKGFGLFHTCSLCTCQSKSPLTKVVDCTTVRATTSY